MEMEMKMEELRIKEEDSIRRAETQLQVALIGTNDKSQEQVNPENAQEDEQSTLDFQLKLEKERNDSKVKFGQLSETIRKNKKAEDQKQQEIEIKRKQANKPVGTNKK